MAMHVPPGAIRQTADSLIARGLLVFEWPGGRRPPAYALSPALAASWRADGGGGKGPTFDPAHPETGAQLLFNANVRNAMKQKPANSAEAAVKAAVDAAKRPLQPPAHISLRECDQPFWAGVILARAREEWSEADPQSENIGA